MTKKNHFESNWPLPKGSSKIDSKFGSIYSWNRSTITTLLCRNFAVLSYSCMVRKIFRINLCLLLPEAKKKGGSILLTAGLPQNRSWRSIIPNWQLNGFLCFAFFDSIKRRSMARSLSQPHCKYFNYQKIQLFSVVCVKLQLAVNYPKLRVEWVPLIWLLWFNKKKINGLLLLSLFLPVRTADIHTPI